MEESRFVMEIMVGQIPIETFEDVKCGLGLLASQLRDSFFDIQLEESGPCLALVSKKASPASIISDQIPRMPEGVGDPENYVVTILSCHEVTPEITSALQNTWQRVAHEVDDLLGGIFTLEGPYLDTENQALFQVIKSTAGWEQYRVHPFSRDDSGNAIPYGTTLVEDNEEGPVDPSVMFHMPDVD